MSRCQDIEIFKKYEEKRKIEKERTAMFNTPPEEKGWWIVGSDEDSADVLRIWYKSSWKKVTLSSETEMTNNGSKSMVTFLLNKSFELIKQNCNISVAPKK